MVIRLAKLIKKYDKAKLKLKGFSMDNNRTQREFLAEKRPQKLF